MRLVIFLVFFFFSFGHSLVAQNGWNRPQRGERGYSPPARVPNAVEPESPDPIILSQERADMYQKLLGIDNFQKEVLKNFLRDHYSKTSTIAFDKDLKFDDKQKAINQEKKTLEKNLLDVFSADQVEAILNEEQFGSKTKEYKKEKKKEKRKKRKKNKSN